MQIDSQGESGSKYYDVIIVGGGAAGMMAAISARRHNPELSVAILDRSFALGRKILICGAGRCNITNVNLSASVAAHYYGAEQAFIDSIFSQFNYEHIVEFFAELGIELYVERKTDIGKLFPITNQAKTVTALLEDELVRLGVDVFLNHEVGKIGKTAGMADNKAVGSDSAGGQSWQLAVAEIDKTGKPVAQKTFHSEYLVLSAGGRTYPSLGSNGSGYELAKTLGHKIIEPVPSALPLEAKDQICHFLQGQKLDLEVTSIVDGARVKTRVDEVLFTKYGLSGPAVLNISREISIALNRTSPAGKAIPEVEVELNFFPGNTPQQARDILEQRWRKRPDQTTSKSLYGLFPNKIADLLPQLANIDPELKVSELAGNQKKALLSLLTAYRIKITATRGWNEAEFTAGGVDSSEIEQGTLSSLRHENLYFCGEILDVDGDVGGFNLSWAWASGYVAGKLGE